MNIYSELNELIEREKEAVFCIITHTEGSAPRKEGTKMIVMPDGKIEGTIGGGSIERQVISDALVVMKSGVPVKKMYKLEDDLEMHCGGKVEVFFDPIMPRPELYIFGAGHIGREVANYASDFGFRISLFDERKEIFDDLDICDFTEVSENYFTAIEKSIFTNNTFVVILTPKHEYDERIVTEIARKPFAYLGMIGSKRKVAEVKKNLKEQHHFTDEQINRIDMPIGIKFNAVTPAEIALSIVAKLIDVKNTLKK
jgi:xanthine dehydrogenase accessory factor